MCRSVVLMIDYFFAKEREVIILNNIAKMKSSKNNTALPMIVEAPILKPLHEKNYRPFIPHRYIDPIYSNRRVSLYFIPPYFLLS